MEINAHCFILYQYAKDWALKVFTLIFDNQSDLKLKTKCVTGVTDMNSMWYLRFKNKDNYFNIYMCMEGPNRSPFSKTSC